MGNDSTGRFDPVDTTTSLIPLVPEPIETLSGERRRQLLNVLLDGFMAHFIQNRSASTVQTYRKRLRIFLRWLETMPPDRPWSATLLQEYRTYLDQHPAIRSTLSKNNALTALRRFTHYLAGLRFARHDPGQTLKGWRASRKHRRHPLPVTDAQAWLHALETDPRKSELQRLRDWALGYLLIKTGLRTCEAARAQLQDLVQDATGQWRLFVQGKGRSADDRDWVRCVPAVMEKLQAYFACRGVRPGDHGPLFASIATHNRAGAVLRPGGRPIGTWTIHRVLTDALLIAGVKHVGIVVHSLRHSAPTYALLASAPPQQVQAMMRHEDYRTTQIYVAEARRLMDGAESYITQI